MGGGIIHSRATSRLTVTSRWPSTDSGAACRVPTGATSTTSTTPRRRSSSTTSTWRRCRCWPSTRLSSPPRLVWAPRLGSRSRPPYSFGGYTTLLVAYGWQFFQHPRHSLRVKNNVELGYMGLRYAGWAALFGYMGLGAAAWLYTVHVAIGASYIFINFAVSHTHRDVVPANKHISWTLYS